jgi:hypothetical protein
MKTSKVVSAVPQIFVKAQREWTDWFKFCGNTAVVESLTVGLLGNDGQHKVIRIQTAKDVIEVLVLLASWSPIQSLMIGSRGWDGQRRTRYFR